MNRSKRILIFNVNWLGDVLFSTAAIRNIRRNFPDGFIACAIPSRCYPILKGNPHLDEVIIFDEKDRDKSLLSKLKFIQSLKAKKFDTVFLLHRSFTRALLCRLADIPERIGYHSKKRGFLLTKSIHPVQKDSMHRIDYYLNVVEQAGFKVEDRYLEFFFSDDDEKYVSDFIKKQGIEKSDLLIGLNPGGNWLPKRWPREYWARLGDMIMDNHPLKVVITGGANDTNLVNQISALMRHKPIIACNVFNVKQLGALCKRLDLFITADTGPLHIANSVGAKAIIALFGPTSPKITGPFPDKNVTIISGHADCKIPCYVINCKDNRCMKTIFPETVLKAVQGILNTGS